MYINNVLFLGFWLSIVPVQDWPVLCQVGCLSLLTYPLSDSYSDTCVRRTVLLFLLTCRLQQKVPLHLIHSVTLHCRRWSCLRLLLSQQSLDKVLPQLLVRTSMDSLLRQSLKSADYLEILTNPCRLRPTHNTTLSLWTVCRQLSRRPFQLLGRRQVLETVGQVLKSAHDLLAPFFSQVCLKTFLPPAELTTICPPR